MIYKTLKKVSEYCQLLDKSKFPATKIVNGVTFTNNGDGTITANGTATANAIFAPISLDNYIDIISGHKFLFASCPPGGSTGTYYSDLKNIPEDESFNDMGGGVIMTTASITTGLRCNIRIMSGYTANNLVFKPQLFDLTEMYGAGNEPTTVEEFRTKFPNELYDYKPYCFVKSYKNCLKVSDYCQLLKPNFLGNQTRAGVTVTSNGDTFTVNGTATSNTFISSQPSSWKPIKGHKMLVCGCPAGGGIGTIYLGALNQYNAEDFGEGSIFTVSNVVAANSVGIYFYKGATFDNLVFKPQLFDLTEMYGAGNEPTTVEEFRTKFPNELYDYKPYSVVPSYKKSLICTTKNLFDNIPVKTNYIINSNGEEVASPGYNIYGKIYGNNFTISTNAPVDLNGPDNWLRVCLYNSGGGTFITRKDFDFNIRTVANIADDNIAYIQLCFHRKSFPNYKLQVELGSTATEYHPYGYL